MIREELGPRPIYLFDSRLATSAQGFLAIEAARMAQKGAEPQVIIEHLIEERKRTGFAAGLETLLYLAKGGRIGKAATMLGSAIHILPVISLDDNGEVAPVSRRQGGNSVLKDAVQMCRGNGISVIPGACPNQFHKTDFGHATMRWLFRTFGLHTVD